MGEISHEANGGVPIEQTPVGMETLVKPVRPDPGEVREQTRQLTAKIERYATRIQEIKDQAATRKGHRHNEPSVEERALMKTLNDTRSNFQAAMRQKQAIRDALNKSNQARESLRIKVRQIKENTKVSSIEEIDSHIKRLEEKVNTEDITEEEEQDCIAKIRQLVRSRETVRSLRKQLDTMQSDETSCEDMTDRLKDVDAELDKCKQREKELSRELDLLKKKREEEEMDFSELMAEKKESWQILCALREKKKEINDAFTERMDIYKKQIQEYHVSRRQLQKEQYLTATVVIHAEVSSRAAEEKAKEEKERTESVIERPAPPKKAAKNDRPAPRQSAPDDSAWQRDREKKKTERRRREREWKDTYRQERVAACVYLLSYLAQFQHPAAKDESESPSEAPAAPVSWSPSQQGLKQLKKAESEDKDAWLMGNKGKKNKHKRLKKPAKVEKPEDKILMHSLQIFQSFSDLKVAPPDTLADVPKAIRTLEGLKLHFETQDIETESQTVTHEVAEAPLIEATVVEQTKDQLPASLEDLDPLESPTRADLVPMGDPEEAPESVVHCSMTVIHDRDVQLELHCT